MTEKVTNIKNKLFKAFEADHATLGRGLYSLRTALAGKDPESVRQIAKGIIQSSGAHIAFEEYDFYPALEKRLSGEEVKTMYLEHAEGLATLQKIIEASDSEIRSELFIKDCLKALDNLDHHVADCGKLFGAMGGLSENDYAHLMERLLYWRGVAPVWTEVETIKNEKLQ